jgi:serine protease Do
MNKKNLLIAAGIAALAVGLIALPSHSRPFQEPEVVAPPAAPEAGAELGAPDIDREFNIVASLSDEGGSWLGVETQEVTAEKAKQLKLSAERGVVIGKVLEDSPAAKSGLKDGDVITEINSQRVEGAVQFRRMIREIPSGRTVQLGIWRDGRAQSVAVTLGKMQEGRRIVRKVGPQVFNFRMPDMPDVVPMPEVPSFEWNGGTLLPGKPRLGIDAEDLSGQLGAYFGAPDGEGILVREVNPGSAAEKAGVKAGDVITSVDGARVRGLAELRSKIASTGEGKTVKLGVLRNKSAMTLDVEVPAAKPKTARKMEMRTRI